MVALLEQEVAELKEAMLASLLVEKSAEYLVGLMGLLKGLLKETRKVEDLVAL
jgi:hypothetical protein